MAELEAGCSAPVGAIAEVVESIDEDGRIFEELSLRGCVAALDGSDVIRASGIGTPERARELGLSLAAELFDLGARDVLDQRTVEREAEMTTRVRKQHKPGRITFTSRFGPGDPGLDDACAERFGACGVDFTDPDVPEAVLALIGTDLPPTSGPHPAAPEAEPAAEAKTIDAAAAAPVAAPAMTFPHGVDVRPALGDPTEVAKLLIARPRPASTWRLVAGDPLSVDAVITEVNALAKAAAHFELVPGLPSSTAVPTYAGLPVGSSHTVADVRGDVDWAALAAAPGR